jgi:hypothetical protein
MHQDMQLSSTHSQGKLHKAAYHSPHLHHSPFNNPLMPEHNLKPAQLELATMLDRDRCACSAVLVSCADVLCAACRRWVDEHGDQARQLQAVEEGRQQAEGRVEELSTQLEQEQQQLAQQRERCALLTTCHCSRSLVARQVSLQKKPSAHKLALRHDCGVMRCMASSLKQLHCKPSIEQAAKLSDVVS